jgi:Tfp pilus assembly protein PilX
MKNKTMHRSTPLRLYQEGAVLIVGLIMVLLITVVGLAAVRGSAMQELMAGNMRDMNLSFQGAEAGLREGETVVNSVAITSAFSGNGLWTDLYLPSASRKPIHEWTTDDWLQAGNSIEASEIDLIGTPRYVIERIVSPIGKINAADGSCIGVGCMSDLPEPEYFRVSSYSRGATPGAQTVVQSTYKTLN